MGLNNCKESSNNIVEGVLCHESDIQENGMKVCELNGVEGGKVLLVKQAGKIRALGTKCSHYGAPLNTGALGEGRIRCPWHGATFCIETGDIEDFPGLDSIPCYNVEVQSDGMVRVKAKKIDLLANKRMRSMTKKDPNNNDVFVIIGAGSAGLVCAETLRQEGFTGKLVMISEEPYLPYDRVKLSKILNAQPENITLRHEAFFKEHDIEIMLNTKADSVDPSEKCVKLDNGSTVSYKALFVATGNRARNMEGVNVGNVFTLRSLSDAQNISQSLSPNAQVVIYGSSFIGMEIAAYCCGKVKSVTVVGRSSVPFKESLGPKVGERIAKLFSEKGVNLVLGRTIKSVEGGDDEKVNSVILDDSTELPADVLILGLGSKPATEFLPQSLRSNPNGTVPVSQFMETKEKDIWAGGDIVEADVLGDRAVIGHYGLASYHGRVAALNMLGKATPLKAVPFFWTVLFGTSFRFTGRNGGTDSEILIGSLDDLKFAMYYCKGEEVKAVATVGSDPVAANFAELLSAGKTLTKSSLDAHPSDWWNHI